MSYPIQLIPTFLALIPTEVIRLPHYQYTLYHSIYAALVQRHLKRHPSICFWFIYVPCVTGVYHGITFSMLVEIRELIIMCLITG